MCRIAGIYNPVDPFEESIAVTKKMCLLLAHGGPDDEGFYTNETDNIVLGHRRLSIVDLSNNGHQPMLYDNNNYVITYNGELYNYLALKHELQGLGYHFVSNTDTEVVIAAYVQWGVTAFNKFEGMFAFCIWDNRQKEIILVRDPAGIKPLYYAHTKNGLAFASEVKALQLLPFLQQTNPNWKAYFLAYGHLPEPITHVKNVVPLQKGTYLRFNTHNGEIVTGNFKNFYFLEKFQHRDDVKNQLNLILASAVKNHLMSDAPIGVFLSGGLDSSIIALLANKVHQRLNTSSIYFENEFYSEKKYQNDIQSFLNCNYHHHLLKEEEFHDYLPDIIQAMDLPCCDGLNTWFISKYAKENGLKAVLSGIGGDELFGGYPSFNRIEQTKLLQQLPNSFLKAAQFTKIKQLRRLAYLSIPGAVGNYLFLRGQFIPSEIAQQLDASQAEIWTILKEQPNVPSINHLTAKNQASWMETNMYMQNQLLRDADVMSMAHGVEIRVPFLDNQFLQFALEISSDIKYAGSFGKQLLIDTFKNELPESIWNRPKMGFSFPFKEWLSNLEYINSDSSNKVGIAHNRLVKNEIHWSQFFTIYLMENKKFSA